jgi:RNA polymerase sigma-70 factor (ECF subfamily)
MNQVHVLEPPNNSDPALLAKKVQDPADDAAFQFLYERFNYYRCRFLRCVGLDSGQDLYHSFIVILITQIRRGELREPERLAGYAKIIAARLLTTCQYNQRRAHVLEVGIDDEGSAIRSRRPTPEQAFASKEEREIAAAVLHVLPHRDREVLVRFYLHEESAEQIQADLNLTETQFRLIKSRAKKRFAELGRARLAFRSPTQSAMAASEKLLAAA